MPKVINTDDFSQGHGLYFKSAGVKSGSPTVYVNGVSVVRATEIDEYFNHEDPFTPSPTHTKIYAIIGSPTVFAEGISIVRDGDPLSCGDVADNGSQNVFADDGGGGGL